MSEPRIVMYASDWCPYCQRARNLLTSKNLTFEEIDVDSAAGLRAEMQQRSSRSSVPQIFIGDRHVGGFDDLSALERSGELDRLLQGST